MRNISFDLCAIPIYALILWTCFFRRMTSGRTNRVFIMMNAASLGCSVAEVAMELLTWSVPLTPVQVVLGTMLSNIYFVLRHATLVVYLTFVFVITRTDYRIRPLRYRLLLWTPNAVTILLVIQNLFTHNVFLIDATNGYSRGPMLMALYVIAALYGLFGTGYCLYCRRYLTLGKWLSLLSVYVLTLVSALVQKLCPTMLVELFSTAVGLMMIMLMVMRPEETMDATVGVQSWKAYQVDLRNLLLSEERIRVMVIQMMNAQEIRAYLGDDRYSEYVREVADEIGGLYRRNRVRSEIYFERPGTFYILMDNTDADLACIARTFLTEMQEKTRKYSDTGVRFDPRICVMRCPEDLSEMKDIVNLGHKFPQIGNPNQVIVDASEVVESRNFEIENNMEEILNRAITENRLEMYYQPIYCPKERRFKSAEALVRLNDSRYGMISPGLFIPAAESLGLILPIGEIVLESVFSFIAGHDLEKLGLSYIEINLSVAQCMQPNLPETIQRLQQKYGVRPDQVNLEITETVFDNIGHVVEKNLNALRAMGYHFSLDDYGTGYSNIQRLCKLPLSIIKIDKSLVDELFTKDGRVIMQNTVRMMHGIEKELVVEGVETERAVEALTKMSCDFIQGFYYSRPLPGAAFVDFIRDKNAAAA